MDTFIKHLDDEVNNLEDKQVNNIRKDEIDDIIPEFEDNIINLQYVTHIYQLLTFLKNHT